MKLVLKAKTVIDCHGIPQYVAGSEGNGNAITGGLNGQKTPKALETKVLPGINGYIKKNGFADLIGNITGGK